MSTSRTRKTIVILAALSMMGTLACSEDLDQAADLNNSGEVEQALAEIGRGMELDDALSRDEDPGFGSERFREAFDGSADRDGEGDDLRERPEPDGDRPEMRIYHIMVTWGRIAPNDSEPVGIRWNPTFRVNEGSAVRVARALRFERNDEVLPQTSRQAVHVTSSTMPHVDGVILQVGVTDATTAALAIETSEISLRYHGAQLHALQERHLLDRSGNGITVVSLDAPDRPDVPACRHGFMAGRWGVSEDGVGVYGGRIMNETGETVGHVAGRYGEGRFHGKVITLEGHFRGMMAGGYADGNYRGELFDREGNAIGHLRGEYGSGDRGWGTFRGGWAANCGDDERPTDERPTDERPTDERPTDERPTDERPTDERPTDERPTDEASGDDGDDG